MDVYSGLMLLQGITLAIFCVVNGLIISYIFLCERERFRVIGIVFGFLSCGCLCVSIESFMMVGGYTRLCLPVIVIGSLSNGFFFSANLLILFFWIHFKRTFYSTTNNQKIVNAIRACSLLIINVGHLVFGLSQFYVLDHKYVVMLMIGLIGVLEIALIILGISLWINLHSESDKGFYIVAKKFVLTIIKVVKMLVALGTLGLLWVFRFVFVVHADSINQRLLFLDLLLSYSILVASLVIYLNYFGKGYLLALIKAPRKKMIPTTCPPPSPMDTPRRNMSFNVNVEASSFDGDMGIDLELSVIDSYPPPVAV